MDNLNSKYLSIQIDEETTKKFDEYQINQNQIKLKIALALYKIKTVFLQLDTLVKKGNTPNLIASIFSLIFKEVKDYSTCLKNENFCIAKFECIKSNDFKEVFPEENDSKNEENSNYLYPCLSTQKQNKMTSFSNINHMVYMPKIGNEKNKIILIDQQEKEEKNKLEFQWNTAYKFFVMNLSEDDSICIITEMLVIQEKDN